MNRVPVSEWARCNFTTSEASPVTFADELKLHVAFPPHWEMARSQIDEMDINSSIPPGLVQIIGQLSFLSILINYMLKTVGFLQADL